MSPLDEVRSLNSRPTSEPGGSRPPLTKTMNTLQECHSRQDRLQVEPNALVDAIARSIRDRTEDIIGHPRLAIPDLDHSLVPLAGHVDERGVLAWLIFLGRLIEMDKKTTRLVAEGKFPGAEEFIESPVVKPLDFVGFEAELPEDETPRSVCGFGRDAHEVNAILGGPFGEEVEVQVVFVLGNV